MPMNDYNRAIVDEFRANEGKVGPPFAGAPLLLLHTTGAKSGKARVNPLAYGTDGDRFIVIGSKGGADDNPDWYHNLLAHPVTDVEVGTETIPVTARVTEGEERERLWTERKREMPGFADYEAKTSREIPVIVLERR
jgi:deazaflavin-dependent oxidoreductase (nitroreductase family)